MAAEALTDPAHTSILADKSTAVAASTAGAENTEAAASTATADSTTAGDITAAVASTAAADSAATAESTAGAASTAAADSAATAESTAGAASTAAAESAAGVESAAGAASTAAAESAAGAESAAADPAPSDTHLSRLRVRAPKIKLVVQRHQLVKAAHTKKIHQKVVTRKDQKKKQRSESGEPEPEVKRYHINSTWTVPQRRPEHHEHCLFCEVAPDTDIGTSIGVMLATVEKEAEKDGEDGASSIATTSDKTDVTSESMEVDDDGEATRGDEAMTADDVVKKETTEENVESAAVDKTVKEEKTEESDTLVKRESTKDEYIMCGFPKCTQRMHKKCADEFTCGEYSPKQAQALFVTERPVCPTHFCSHCYEERHKNASRFGELVDCLQCMRSFHEICLPAGCKLTGEKNTPLGKRKTFTCHMHALRQPNITKRMRLKECVECQVPFKKPENGVYADPAEEPVDCKSCTNVFHRGCTYDEVKGPGSEKYKDRDTCAYCITGWAILPGQMVIAYCPYSFKDLPAGTYPAEAISLSEVPQNLISQVGKKNFGQPGFIPVKWIWNATETPYYNLIPASHVQRMMIGGERNLVIKDFTNEWKQAERKFKAPVCPLDHNAMRKSLRIVMDNFTKGGRNLLTFTQDTMICMCKVNEKTGIKCDTDKCLNRGTKAECPKECDEKEGVTCANRILQSAERKTLKVEVKEAPNGKGMGLFALNDMKEGEFIIEYCGEVIDGKQLKSREERMVFLRSHDEFTYVMGLGRGLFVDARFRGSLARYANHSCDPNAEVTTVDVPQGRINNDESKYQNRLKMFALRDIEAGEEITFNYSLKKSAKLAIDACRCGSEKCTGHLGRNRDDERLDENAPVIIISDEDEDVFDEEEEEAKENKEKKPAKSMTKTEVKVEAVVEEPKKTVSKRRASKAFPELATGPSTSAARLPSISEPSGSSTSRSARRSILLPKKRAK